MKCDFCGIEDKDRFYMYFIKQIYTKKEIIFTACEKCAEEDIKELLGRSIYDQKRKIQE